MLNTDLPRTLTQRTATLVIAFLCVSCGLAPSERDYRSATKVGTEEAYREYLQKHPEGYLSARIAFRLIPAASIEAYREFIARYPDSKEANYARMQIAYMQREAELYAEFGRANANDALPLIKKHGLAGIEHHLIGLVGRRWARVPAEDIEPLRIAVVDPVRLEYAQTKKAMAGTSFNTMTITGGRKYEAALTGIYYSDGDFLFVEAAVVDGKRYPGLAYYSVDGSEGFFKPKDDQAGN